MRVMVTGSAGHLGEGLVRTLRERGHEVFLFAIPGENAARARAAGLEFVGQPENTRRPTWRSALRLRRA